MQNSAAGAIPELTTEQLRALDTLIATGNVTKAAQAAGVDRNTVYNWLKTDNFKAAMRFAQSQTLQVLANSLVGLGPLAVQALHDALENRNSWIRLKAVELVLGRMLDLVQLVELESRITELEATIGNNGAEQA